MALAIMIAESPTPPQPCTATHSPACTRPWSTMARNDVTNRQPRLAAVAKSSSSGSRDEIGVGKVDRDIFGERAPSGEARLELVLADLVIAGMAFAAMAAAGDERHGHPVAGAPPRHLPADGLDRAGQFVARHMRQRDIGIMAHPAMPVAAAKPGRLHLDDHALRSRRRVGHI